MFPYTTQSGPLTRVLSFLCLVPLGLVLIGLGSVTRGSSWLQALMADWQRSLFFFSVNGRLQSRITKLMGVKKCSDQIVVYVMRCLFCLSVACSKIPRIMRSPRVNLVLLLSKLVCWKFQKIFSGISELPLDDAQEIGMASLDGSVY